MVPELNPEDENQRGYSTNKKEKRFRKIGKLPKFVELFRLVS
jgi:hypothetical protein